MLSVNYVAEDRIVKANPTDAGWDLKCIEEVTFQPGDCKCLPVGTFLDIDRSPEAFQPKLACSKQHTGHWAMGTPIEESKSFPLGKMIDIRGRSGLAKEGFIAHYGTVDETYQSEISVVLHYNPPEERPTWKKMLNILTLGLYFNKPSYTFAKGDKVCQMVFMPFYNVDMKKVERDENWKEDRGGWGSTGS
jgi:dUTPase